MPEPIAVTRQQALLEQAEALIARYQSATLAVRQQAGEEQVHDYRVAGRRLLALFALWRPLVYRPELERRLRQAVQRLSALRDAQVYAARFDFLGETPSVTDIRVPLLTGGLSEWTEAIRRMPVWVDLALLHRQHLALRLWQALESLASCKKGDRLNLRTLRHWHRLRLEIKQTRYGVELLLPLGEGEKDWLVTLTAWQEQLGQLQDWRQWRKRLRGPARTGTQIKRARMERQQLRQQMVLRLHQLDCQQAELVGLKIALQRSG